MSLYDEEISNKYGIDKLWDGPKIKGTPISLYRFNIYEEPKILYDLLKDLLKICHVDSSILTHKLQFKDNTIVDIRLITKSGGYNEHRLIFIEHITSLETAYDSNCNYSIRLLDFLEFFNNLSRPAQRSLLNTVLKTDYDNRLYSYQIKDNTITFI